MNLSPLGITLALISSVQVLHASDTFAGAPLVANNSTVSGDNSSATTEPGEPSYVGYHTMWYRYVAPKRGVVRITTPASPKILGGHQIHVFRGSTLSAINLVDWDTTVNSSRDNITLTFPAKAGMEFRICFASGISSRSGAFNFTVQQDAWPYGNPAGILVAPAIPASLLPANDEFTRATVIPSSVNPVSVLGFNHSATQSNLGPEPSLTGYRTLWYRWKAPKRGIAVISTPASPVLGYRHTLSVFRGNAITALTTVEGVDADNDEGASVSFPVEKGLEYRICLGGLNDRSAGPFVFTVRTDAWRLGATALVPPRMPVSSTPRNDQFEGATTIPGRLGKFTILDYNRSATTASSAIEPKVGYKSLWYKWKAPATTYVALRTPGTTTLNYSHIIAAYTGTRYANLNLLPDDLGSAVVSVSQTSSGGECGFEAKKGRTYYFSFTTFSESSGGPVVFSLQSGPNVNRTGPSALITSPGINQTVSTGGFYVDGRIGNDPQGVRLVSLKVNGKVVHRRPPQLGGIFSQRVRAGRVKLELQAMDGFGRWGKPSIRYVTAK